MAAVTATSNGAATAADFISAKIRRRGGERHIPAKATNA
jgi:hypothetical protein